MTYITPTPPMFLECMPCLPRGSCTLGVLPAIKHIVWFDNLWWLSLAQARLLDDGLEGRSSIEGEHDALATFSENELIRPVWTIWCPLNGRVSENASYGPVVCRVGLNVFRCGLPGRGLMRGPDEAWKSLRQMAVSGERYLQLASLAACVLFICKKDLRPPLGTAVQRLCVAGPGRFPTARQPAWKTGSRGDRPVWVPLASIASPGRPPTDSRAAIRLRGLRIMPTGIDIKATWPVQEVSLRHRPTAPPEVQRCCGLHVAESVCFQIIYTAIVGLVMLAALLEWVLWIAAFVYCLVKVFQKAEHWTIRVLALTVGISFTLLRSVAAARPRFTASR